MKLKKEKGKKFDTRDERASYDTLTATCSYTLTHTCGYTYIERTHTYPIDLPFAVRRNTRLPYSYIHLRCESVVSERSEPRRTPIRSSNRSLLRHLVRCNGETHPRGLSAALFWDRSARKSRDRSKTILLERSKGCLFFFDCSPPSSLPFPGF